MQPVPLSLPLCHPPCTLPPPPTQMAERTRNARKAADAQDVKRKHVQVREEGGSEGAKQGMTGVQDVKRKHMQVRRGRVRV